MRIPGRDSSSFKSDAELWELFLGRVRASGAPDRRGIEAALARGRSLAAPLDAGAGLEPLLEPLGIRVRIRTDQEHAAGVRFRSRFVEGSGEIEVWAAAAERMALSCAGLGLDRDRALTMLTAHELWHALTPGPGHGRWAAEIGASAFVKALLGLEFNPVAVDLIEAGLGSEVPGAWKDD